MLTTSRARTGRRVPAAGRFVVPTAPARRLAVPVATLALAALALSLALAPLPARALDVDAGTQFGYSGGPGGEAHVQLLQPAEGLPLDLRFGLEYVVRDPGKAEDARRIFINDATNGTPEEAGRTWISRFDLVHPLSFGFLPGQGWSLAAGVRYARHTSNFRFIGGNEDFDVTSRQWGTGLGLEGRFPVARQTLLLLGGGVDWFFDATLKGHDTSYSPDGETVNGRRDYGWSDADDAIAQPKLNPRMMIGLAHRFGR